jgi:hypothetical protein
LVGYTVHVDRVRMRVLDDYHLQRTFLHRD